MNAIAISDLTKVFKEGVTGKKVSALEPLTLDLPEGEVFGFLGPNGAGKSTTIKILLNLIFATSGTASIMGIDVNSVDARRCVGYLPENPFFYDYLSAEELLNFGGKASGLSSSVIKKRTELLLEKVGLIDAGKRRLRSYSKGMVQRAGLALALIHDPEVLIFDEPMSGLDPIGRKMVGDLILELKEEGKTVFFSSHILTDIERFCDRVGIIVKGRLRMVEKMDSLVSSKDTLEERFLAEVEKAGGGSEL